MRILSCLSFLFCVLAGSVAAASTDWLEALARQPAPGESTLAPAWVLLDETTLEVDEQGYYTETHRVAIRLRINAGRSYAQGVVSYNGKSDKVQSVGAWLIRKGKIVQDKTGSDWADREAGSTGSIIDEMRKREIDLREFAVGEDVFGYETRIRGPLLVAQVGADFGYEIPVSDGIFRLILPAGFSVEAHTQGYRPLVASEVPGQRTWVWTLRDPVYTPDEPWLAPSAKSDARLFVRILPPPEAKKFAPRTFASWEELATWKLALNVNQCDASPELVAKARELTATSTDLLAKIRAVCGYVQKLRYVAINEGLRLGRGYQARKASRVFARGFGDCKDKANLLRAMLREVGVTAFMVSAYSGEGCEIMEACPTPFQFNHAILAVAVGDAVQLPTVVATEKQGRLLFFDPTDEHTLLGDLPAQLQGTKVLVTVEGGPLVTLPVLPKAQGFALRRHVRLRLAEDGSISADGKVIALGQEGANLRCACEAANMPKDKEALATRQLSDGFRSAVVRETKTEDDLLTGQCTFSFGCDQKRYIQSLQGGRTVVKLDVLNRRNLPAFPEKVRYRPIELSPLELADEITLVLPDGQTVEELPATVKLQTPYGDYETTCITEQQTVVLRRRLSLNKIEVPVADYEKLKKFLADIARADRSSVLLKSHL